MPDINLSHETIEFIIRWLKDPAILIAVCAWLNRGYKKTREYIQSLITERLNQIKYSVLSDVKKYIDDKFEEHERNAFGRLDSIKKEIIKQNE